MASAKRRRISLIHNPPGLLSLGNNNNTKDSEEDMISELPESLIVHILSFLPTKLAVSTTFLSKRWNNLWISLPVLDFREWRTWIDDQIIRGKSREQLLERTNRFMAFLDRTLLFNNISTIQKFCLNCDSDEFDENRVKEWITAVLKRKVEELILIVKWPNPKLVPLEIFTCQSLTMLEINFEFKGCVLDFPRSISLPRLKVLRLSGVKFNDTASTQNLFSNCPILEELVLRDCIGEDIISFSAPHLKKFAYDNGLKVDIDAPNLESIKFCGRLPTDFHLGRFPSLDEVDFSNSFPAETTTEDSFTRMCSNIKSLKISEDYLQFFPKQKLRSIALDKLTHLEVSYHHDPHTGRSSNDPHTSRSSIKSLFNFLHFTQNLESLVIYQAHCTQKIDGNMDRYRPLSCLKQLKSIEFRNFKESPEEMCLVELILKHAPVLKRVIIRSIVSLSAEQDFLNEGIIEKLLTFRKASTNCSFQSFETSC